MRQIKCISIHLILKAGWLKAMYTHALAAVNAYLGSTVTRTPAGFMEFCTNSSAYSDG